jgi:hypothetical protein
MKVAIIAILAISAVSDAVAVNIYAYSDVLFTSCTTPVSSQVLDQYKVSDPIEVPQGECIKMYDNGMDLYFKYEFCQADDKRHLGLYRLYNNAACTTCPGGQCKDEYFIPGACVAPSSTGFPGIKAFRITCSATNAGLAIVSVAAAALAWCL